MKLTYKNMFERYRDTNVLDKSRQYAKWTLPKLMAELCMVKGATAGRLERDYQDIGALLVNNLSAKLAALLFPTSRPFYRIKLSDALKKKAEQEGIQNIDLQSGFARMEQESCQQVFLNASYEQLILALAHLIVTGNVLVFRDSKNKRTLCYGLESFSVLRDGRGSMMECILREYTDFESLAGDIQTVLKAKHRSKYRGPKGSNKVDLFTRIERVIGEHDNVTYRVSQEVDGVPVGEPGSYPEHLCPWIVPTWSLVIGENYGRGLVEDYAGGFAKLSDTSHASTLYQIAAAKVLNLVAPGTNADVDEMESAECGEYVVGGKDSVVAHESGDAQKMAQMEASIEAQFQRLARAFMYKANTRNAERVTAFELRQDALEAENTLGGAYSSLSASVQVPMAHILLTEINPGALAGLITQSMKLDISAGIPALGRASDVQNLTQATQEVGAILPVLVDVDKRFDPKKLVDMIMAGQSVDTSALFRSEEEMAQMEKAEKDAAQAQTDINNTATLDGQAEQLQGLQA